VYSVEQLISAANRTATLLTADSIDTLTRYAQCTGDVPVAAPWQALVAVEDAHSIICLDGVKPT